MTLLSTQNINFGLPYKHYLLSFELLRPPDILWLKLIFLAFLSNSNYFQNSDWIIKDQTFWFR